MNSQAAEKKGMYEVRYVAYGNDSRLVRKQMFFETAEARKRHLDDLRSCGCLYAVLGWSDPK